MTYILTSSPYYTFTSSTYNGLSITPTVRFVYDLFGTESNAYKKLMIELNTASQHLLIEIERMSALNRCLTEAEHGELMALFDRQIAAQSALQRHLHAFYEGTQYIG